MTEILTERLLLRRARQDDLSDLHRILSDPVATRYWSTPPHADPDVTQEWLDAMMDKTKERDDFVVLCEGQVIGKIGCYQPPDLGFIFSKDVWGKGLTREAARAYIDHAAKGPMTYLTADVDPHNAVCLGFLAHLGFKTTGFASRTWLVGDTWCDSIYLRRDL